MRTPAQIGIAPLLSSRMAMAEPMTSCMSAYVGTVQEKQQASQLITSAMVCAGYCYQPASRRLYGC